LLTTTLRRVGPLLALALALAAAVASLLGQNTVLRLVGSGWFLAGAGLLGLACLLVVAKAVRRRNWAGGVQHLGLAVALAGVAVNQHAARAGYFFLEEGAGGRDYCLSRDLRRVEGLPGGFALESLGSRTTRGFRPAPVAWVSDVTRAKSRPVTYNQPFTHAGRQLVLSQLVEPGFLEDYRILVDGEEYLLMHNQALELDYGLRVWSFGFDPAAKKVGLVVGSNQQWLGIGESTVVSGVALRLLESTYATRAGVIFMVNDVRYRFIIFGGFGLVLLGLLPPLFRRETP